MYTFGVKGITDDRVYLFNMPELEAVRICALMNLCFVGQFKVAHISKKNCPPLDKNKPRTVIA